MRKLYEINYDIENLIEAMTDPETGEVTDPDALNDLYLERDQKIESVALYCKDIDQEITAISNEIATLQKRLDRRKNTREGLKVYLAKALHGEKFSTARCEMNFRKSEAVELDEFGFMDWAVQNEDDFNAFITRKVSDTPNKAAIKKFLKDGGSLPYCTLVERQNLTIK